MQSVYQIHVAIVNIQFAPRKGIVIDDGTVINECVVRVAGSVNESQHFDTQKM